MTKVLYEQPGIVKAEYERAVNGVLVHWSDLGPHDYLRPCVESQLNSVLADGARTIVVNLLAASGAPDPGDLARLGEELLPRLGQGGLRAIIIVGGRRDGTGPWREAARKYGIESQDCDGLGPALELARRYSF